MAQRVWKRGTPLEMIELPDPTPKSDEVGCRALLRSGGRHVIVTGEAPSAVGQILVPPFSSKLVLAEPRTQHLQPVMDALAAGTVTIAIAERLPLHELQRAHDLSATGRMTGKIVMIP